MMMYWRNVMTRSRLRGEHIRPTIAGFFLPDHDPPSFQSLASNLITNSGLTQTHPSTMRGGTLSGVNGNAVRCATQFVAVVEEAAALPTCGEFTLSAVEGLRPRPELAEGVLRIGKLRKSRGSESRASQAVAPGAQPGCQASKINTAQQRFRVIGPHLLT